MRNFPRGEDITPIYWYKGDKMAEAVVVVSTDKEGGVKIQTPTIKGSM